MGFRIKVVQETLNLLEVVQYHQPQPFVFVPQLAEGIVSEAMQCEFESHRRHHSGIVQS